MNEGNLVLVSYRKGYFVEGAVIKAEQAEPVMSTYRGPGVHGAFSHQFAINDPEPGKNAVHRHSDLAVFHLRFDLLRDGPQRLEISIALDLGWQKFLGVEYRFAAPHGLARPIVMEPRPAAPPMQPAR